MRVCVNRLEFLTCVLFFAFFSVKVMAQGQVLGGKESEHPDWFKESFLEIAEDVAEATEENRHVMLFLYLNGCPYCYKMIEENIKHAPYTDFIRQNFDVIALNIYGDREVAIDDETTMTEKAFAKKLRAVYTPGVVFLNAENKIVARIDGYRSVPDFKRVLNYVQQKAYETTTLASYLNQQKSQLYSFRDHPQIIQTENLQALSNKPLAVMFEDQNCIDCAALHDGHLANPEFRKILESFSLVRLDALSEERIIYVDGNETTPKAYTEKLGLTYRPGIVLFDKGRDVMRIQSMLYSYHFSEVLRYVGERHYEKYPDDFYDYLDVKTAAIIESGKNVHISD